MKKILTGITALSLLTGMLPLTAAAEEETPWTVREGHRYQVFDESLSWTEARIRCALLGGHLVSIGDAEEQAFVEKLVTGHAKENYWIGLYDLEGEWKWEDGTAYDYTNWDLDAKTDIQKPDNHSGEEYFGKLYAKSAEFEDWSCNAGKWDDAADEADEAVPLSKYGYVCEWDTLNAKKAEGTAQGILLHGTHLYQLFEQEGITWQEAKTLCEEKGGHLVTVTDADEEKALESLLADAATAKGYYMGASDAEEEGKFQWVTGEEFSYTHWGEQGPNDSKQYISEGEDYLGIALTETNWSNPFDWNDFIPDSNYIGGYICEWETEPVSFAYNGHIYKRFDVGFTWDNARMICEMLGGHLVTIADEDEQQFVQTMFGKEGEEDEYTRNSYWMGAKVRAKQIYWVTDEKTEYTNWAPYQPDNAYGIGEDSLMLYIKRNPVAATAPYLWNDLRADGTCNSEEFFGLNNFGLICEWDSSADVPAEFLKNAYLRGDTNVDQKVTIADAVLLARVAAEDTKAVITEQGKRNGELDGEEGLTSNDLTALLKLLAGVEAASQPEESV